MDPEFYVHILSQCEAYEAKLRGLHHTDGKTTSYARIVKHQNHPTFYMVIIKPDLNGSDDNPVSQATIDANSTGAEIAARKRLSILAGEGAFDVVP